MSVPMYLEVIETQSHATQDIWFESNTFLIFDLETTGVNVRTDLPVSYALVGMRGETCIYEGYSVVNPDREIPDEASQIHGISTERARDFGVPLDQAIHTITDELLRASARGWYVVGMNISFDLSIVDARCRDLLGVGLNELGFNAPILDALVLDRHYDPFRSGRRTLDALVGTYQVTSGKFHDALEDCKITYRVLQALVRKFPDISGIDPVSATETLESYHKTWVDNYNTWAATKGREQLDFTGWPIA